MVLRTTMLTELSIRLFGDVDGQAALPGYSELHAVLLWCLAVVVMLVVWPFSGSAFRRWLYCGVNSLLFTVPSNKGGFWCLLWQWMKAVDTVWCSLLNFITPSTPSKLPKIGFAHLMVNFVGSTRACFVVDSTFRWNCISHFSCSVKHRPGLFWYSSKLCILHNSILIENPSRTWFGLFFSFHLSFFGIKIDKFMACFVMTIEKAYS